MRLNLHWRLALAYGSILFVAILAFSLFVYRNEERFLLDSTVERLESQAAVGIRTRVQGPPLGINPQATAQGLARALSSAQTSVLLFDTELGVIDSALTAESTGSGLSAREDILAASLATGRNHHEVIDGSHGARAIVLAVPILAPGGNVTGLVYIEHSLDSVDSYLGRLAFLLLGGGVLTFVLATAAAWMVTRWFLRHLGNIAYTARQITAGNYSERIEQPGVDGELAEVAASLNLMLDELEATLARRQQSEELTRRFAADASHELKSPLTVLNGYIDVLLRSSQVNDPETVTRSLEAMRRETSRMMTLVRNLLDLARLDIEASIRPEPCALDDFLLSMFDEASLLSPSHRFEIETDPGLVAPADLDFLRQAMRNLIENAVRHTPPEGLITLSGKDRGAHVELAVTDTGEGIAPEHLEHLTERFYRAERARTRGDGNAGLGLAIVEAIAVAHGGQVRVQSEVGAGSTFSILLPKRSSLSATDETEEQAEHSGSVKASVLP